jgi:hypothetical protein
VTLVEWPHGYQSQALNLIEEAKMVWFGIISRSPVPALVLPMLILIALFELIGLKIRRNILVLSVVGLVCLVAAAPVGMSSPDVAGWLYATRVTLSVILALYTLATARRGKQRGWFVGVLLGAIAALVGIVTARAMLTQQNALLIGVMIFALSFAPAMSTLLYGLFAPDIPKSRASV